MRKAELAFEIGLHSDNFSRWAADGTITDLPEGFKWNVGIKAFNAHGGASMLSDQKVISL